MVHNVQSTKPPKRLLTINEFSAGYGPCRTKVYALLKSGEISGVKSGRLTLIPYDEAESWAQRLPKYEPGATVAVLTGSQSKETGNG